MTVMVDFLLGALDYRELLPHTLYTCIHSVMKIVFYNSLNFFSFSKML